MLGELQREKEDRENSVRERERERERDRERKKGRGTERERERERESSLCKSPSSCYFFCRSAVSLITAVTINFSHLFALFLSTSRDLNFCNQLLC